MNWVNADVTAARNAGAKQILAIGHKPAYGWSGAPTDSLLGKGNTPVAFHQGLHDQFWGSLEASQGGDVLRAQMRPNNKTWQIIAGNGGSALESSVGTGTGGPNGLSPSRATVETFHRLATGRPHPRLPSQPRFETART